MEEVYLDVRTKKEYDEKYLRNAINLDYYNEDLGFIQELSLT